MLVVHSDGVDKDTMGAEELDGSTQGDSGVLGAEAHQRLDIDISTMAADLKISRAGTAYFREGSSIIQMEHGGVWDISEGGYLRGGVYEVYK